MKILVVSDIHGSELFLEKAYLKEKPDAVWFLGDGIGDFIHARDYIFDGACETSAVLGNCDYGWSGEYVSEQIAAAGNAKFFLAHGHRHGVRNGIRDICIEAYAQGCGYALFGHTHCQERGTYFGVTALNPGTITRGDYLVIVFAGGKPEFTFKNLADS